MKKVNVSSYFIAQGLLSDTDIKNRIMNCDSSEHPKLYEAIFNHMEASEQRIMPFSQWVNEYDPSFHTVGSADAGSYTRAKIEEDYYG